MRLIALATLRPALLKSRRDRPSGSSLIATVAVGYWKVCTLAGRQRCERVSMKRAELQAGMTMFSRIRD
jgi:hypothetical protein